MAGIQGTGNTKCSRKYRALKLGSLIKEMQDCTGFLTIPSSSGTLRYLSKKFEKLGPQKIRTEICGFIVTINWKQPSVSP